MKATSTATMVAAGTILGVGLGAGVGLRRQAPRPGVITRRRRPRMATAIPPSITTPDSVETRLGTLRFVDGFPDEATIRAVYGNLDFQRGVQAFLASIPAASFHAMRRGLRAFGPDNRTVLMTGTLMDSRTLMLTANTETIYNLVWLDTHDGLLVIEVPPNVFGAIDDFWMRYVGDVGNSGPDEGSGGRYLLLPPGHIGDVPDGYFVLRSRTYGNWLFFRGFIEDGDTRPAVENVKRRFRVHRLNDAGNPPAMNFVDVSGESFNTIHANDFSFYEEVARVVDEEPIDAVDPEVRGLLASIGIRKGRPFDPDARMRRILAEAAAVGNATARAIAFGTRDPDAYLHPGSAWKRPWIGNDFEFSPGGVLNPDARSLYYFLGVGVSPAMIEEAVGRGSQYAYAEHDASGEYLDGGRSYRLRLPPEIPVKDFWSLVVYDPQTRSMLQTDQRFPSISSQKEGIVVNRDTSIDITFGPDPIPGREGNWVQTVPGKGWSMALRLYGPLESWFDGTWRPGEIERIG